MTDPRNSRRPVVNRRRQPSVLSLLATIVVCGIVTIGCSYAAYLSWWLMTHDVVTVTHFGYEVATSPTPNELNGFWRALLIPSLVIAALAAFGRFCFALFQLFGDYR